jgi:hypothetical protein
VRPVIRDGIPASAGLYQVIPWEHSKTGDLLKHKDPEIQVRARARGGSQIVLGEAEPACAELYC